MGNELSGDGNDQIGDLLNALGTALEDDEGAQGISNGLSKVLSNGLGKKIWYVCEACKKEVWAYESFAGQKCWNCMAGEEGSKVGQGASNIMSKSDPEFFKRLNRFQTMDNGYLFRPVTSLKASNYSTIYEQYDDRNDNDNDNDNRIMITDNDIIEILTAKYSSNNANNNNNENNVNEEKNNNGNNNDNNNNNNGGHGGIVETYKNLDKNKYDSVPKKCVYLWTIGQPEIYSDLCKILETDDYKDLKLYMPLIYGINLYLLNHSINENIVTYRGSHINEEQFEFIEMNKVYRITKFLATSRDKDVANAFKTETMVLVTFIIDKNYKHGAYLGDYSYFGQRESEVLITPYSAIKIIGIDKDHKELTVKLLDSDDVSKTAPQIHL